MRRGKYKVCEASILYLDTKGHIQFGGMPPPVQKDDLCPCCWMNENPKEEMPGLPGWETYLKRHKLYVRRKN